MDPLDAFAAGQPVQSAPPSSPPPSPQRPVQSAPAAPAQHASTDALANFASGGGGLPKPPNALAAIGDVLDLPFVAGGALVRGGKPYTNTAELKKVIDEIRQHGERGLEDVNRRYNLFSPEQLHDQAAHGDTLSGYFEKNPKIGPVPVAAVADFLAEFGNPTNALMGPLVGTAGRGLRAVGSAIDRVAPPVAKVAGGVKREFSPLASETSAGEAAKRQYLAAKATADERADAILKPIFNNLPQVARNEVARRSENLGPKGVQNPPRAVPGVDDALLDQRAQALRAALHALDREQLNYQAIEPNRVRDSSTYTPRHAVDYVDRNAPPGTKLGDFLKEAPPAQPGGARDFRRGTAGAGKQKEYATHDEAEASGNLRPDYDASHTILNHFRERINNVERVKAGLRFRQAGLAERLQYTDAAGKTLGYGVPGYDALQKYAGRAATPLAHAQTAQNLGLSPGTKLRGVQVAPAFARFQEAQRAADAAGKALGAADTGAIGTRRAANDVMQRFGVPARRAPKAVRDISQPSARAANFIFRQSTGAQDRANKLLTKLDVARINDRRAEQYRTVFQSLFPGIKSGIIDAGERRAKATAMQGGAGKLPVDLAAYVGPAGAHMAADPELIDFLHTQGATPQDAHGMAAFIDKMNALTRVGIIANPFVHILWNLNTQFMGAGGTIGEISSKVWNPMWRPDAKWAQAAARDGAVPHFSPQMQNLLGAKDYGEYGKLVGAASDLSPLGRVNRGITKAWQYNQDIVFNTAEHRYATLLYQKFVESGMDGKTAGIAVRKALGDYANVSRVGIEAGLNKALFFYPWLKTVIPFWLKTLGEHPQRLNAPLQAVRASNTAMGDPNLDREQPNALYLGPGAGNQDRYFSIPVPIKYVNDLLSIAAPQGNPMGGMTERVGAGLRVVESHANPVLATGLETLNTELSPAAEPGGAALYTLWNKAAPPEVQAQQLTTNLAAKALPLPLQIRQMIEFLRDLPGLPDPASAMIGGATAGVVGGTAYGRPNPGKQAALRTLQGRMTLLVSQARKAGNDDAARAIYHAYIDAMHRVERGE